MAILPPPLNPDDQHAQPQQAAAPAPRPNARPPEPMDALPVMTGWVRGTLVGIALGLIALFSVAAWLNPYQTDGSARRMETHRQLGLPECTFKKLTGIPCPSCGMTTSFALTIRGDLVNAAQANCVGMLLAVTLLVVGPWCVASAVFGRTLFVRSVERAVMVMVIGLLALMLLRWGLYLGLTYWLGAPPRF